MTFLTAIKGQLVGRLARIYFAWRICQGWSRFYRWAFERKYRDAPLPYWPHSFADMVGHARANFTWAADGPGKLFDVISYPGRIEVTKHDDCDGFAIWNAALLWRVAQYDWHGWRDTKVTAIRLLTVVYQHADGTLGAHTVCVFRSHRAPDGGCFGWMDYRVPLGRYSTYEAVAVGVMQAYKACVVLAFAVTDPVTLAPIKVGTVPPIGDYYAPEPPCAGCTVSWIHLPTTNEK